VTIRGSNNITPASSIICTTRHTISAILAWLAQYPAVLRKLANSLEAQNLVRFTLANRRLRNICSATPYNTWQLLPIHRSQPLRLPPAVHPLRGNKDDDDRPDSGILNNAAIRPCNAALHCTSSARDSPHGPAISSHFSIPSLMGFCFVEFLHPFGRMKIFTSAAIREPETTEFPITCTT
jgi:hypothetical protein